MELEGKVWKEGKVWLIEIQALDVMTQGKTKEDAFFMIEDVVEELMHSYFKDEYLKGFKAEAIDCENGVVVVTANDTKLLLALSLRRQREKSGSTIKEVAGRLGSKAPNSYAQYERGFTNVTVEKYEELLVAVNPRGGLRLRLT